MPLLSRRATALRAMPRMPWYVSREVTMYTGANGSSGDDVVVVATGAAVLSIRTRRREGASPVAATCDAAAARVAVDGTGRGVSERTITTLATRESRSVVGPSRNGFIVASPGSRPAA